MTREGHQCCVEQDGNTPLHLVAMGKGAAGIAQILLESGADVNALNQVGLSIYLLLHMHCKRQQKHHAWALQVTF